MQRSQPETRSCSRSALRAAGPPAVQARMAFEEVEVRGPGNWWRPTRPPPTYGAAGDRRALLGKVANHVGHVLVVLVLGGRQPRGGRRWGRQRRSRRRPRTCSLGRGQGHGPPPRSPDPPLVDLSAGSATTLRWCRKIQKTSLVTLTASLHHTRYGRSRRISSTNETGCSSSLASGSRRYRSTVLALAGLSCGAALWMYVNSTDVMMLRVVNSLGPFFSGSKIMWMRAGRSVAWIE